MNKFQKYGLLLAIILSFLLHFIVIKSFPFKIFYSNNQESFDNIEISILKPSNSLPFEQDKILPNDVRGVSKKSIIISNENINNNHNSKNYRLEKDMDPKVAKESNKKLIDSSKILSEIKKIEFTTQTESRNKKNRIKSISANTNDYIYRLYFEAWRQKVEKIGAMNYPKEASKLGMFGSLRLTVSLNSDGIIENLFINKSSGYKELDEAAMNIVRLGAPYAKFPAEIQKKIDIINITRKWKFTKKNNFSQ